MKSVKLKLHMFSSIFAYKLAYFTVETITVGGQRTKLQVTRTALLYLLVFSAWHFAFLLRQDVPNFH
jgi:hypothetical protein